MSDEQKHTIHDFDNIEHVSIMNDNWDLGCTMLDWTGLLDWR